MMAGSGHDSVKYSLLNDQDTTAAQLEDIKQEDTFHVTTATTRTSGPSAVNMFAGRLRGSQRITFLAILTAAFIVIIWLLSHMDTAESQINDSGVQVPFTRSSSLKFGNALKPDGSAKASDLKVGQDLKDTYNWYLHNCYEPEEPEELGRSISDVFKKLQLLKASTIDGCRSIWDIFDSMLRIDEVKAPIILPELFQIEVKGWLDNNDKLFEQVNHQVIYKIINKGTYEETVINPIRSRRPVSKPTVDPITYINNLTETSRPNCDFCNYKDHTAEDTFGRIDNKLSASCSNTFKLAKFHAKVNDFPV